MRTDRELHDIALSYARSLPGGTAWSVEPYLALPDPEGRFYWNVRDGRSYTGGTTPCYFVHRASGEITVVDTRSILPYTMEMLIRDEELRAVLSRPPRDLSDPRSVEVFSAIGREWLLDCGEPVPRSGPRDGDGENWIEGAMMAAATFFPRHQAFDMLLAANALRHARAEPLVRGEQQRLTLRLTWATGGNRPEHAPVIEVSPAARLVRKVVLHDHHVKCAGARTHDRHRLLDDAEAAELERAVESASFWALPETDDMRSLDGAHLVVEGRDGLQHRVVSRMGPDPQGNESLFALCAAMLRVARIPSELLPPRLLRLVEGAAA